ncbi:hypothetical protein BT96DRAFT_924943 [Gymnopus androsaceus JB14]|uniref:Uncharacterized protein n=1 Tax=Gymnopus androsaceus JB14 TaxID=1447944 RepID=A0A6A4H1G4_9AGAR|nr:hypothetical protein BT96DRAFT_929978 [Gymnopus androsaceus JB14]KAE9392069.1 hypothetical protein BT96DRAFT_924943 [Gymnopus androsaceus JB14]
MHIYSGPTAVITKDPDYGKVIFGPSNNPYGIKRQRMTLGKFYPVCFVSSSS